MYTAHYINPLSQFGCIEFDLVIKDTDNVLPSYRIHKSFDALITEEELAAIADSEISRILEEQQIDSANKQVSVIIDFPSKGE